jgi:hypothetical protein
MYFSIFLNFVGILLILSTPIETKTMPNTGQGRRRFCSNGFCGIGGPPPQAQKQIDTKIHVKHIAEKEETPYGCVRFYPGRKNPLTCTVMKTHLEGEGVGDYE